MFFQLLRNLLLVFAQVGYEVAEQRTVFVCQESDDLALSSSSAGSSCAVDVGLNRLRAVVVYDLVDARDVQTSTR